MIEIWHKNCKEMRAHEIIDTFQEHKVSSYFQRELNIIGRNPEAVYDILFKGTDFSIFTRDTLDFYEDVLSGFLVSYVDGFREKGKRDDIEKKIRILETYVNSIPEDYVRNILEKRLFLCKGRYSRSEGKVYAPADGTVANIMESKHGIMFVTESGAEILIHIGIDTVNLNGKYFKSHVSDGDKVKKGKLLVEFDMDAIKKEGYDLITPVVVTNISDYIKAVCMEKEDAAVNAGDKFLTIV